MRHSNRDIPSESFTKLYINCQGRIKRRINKILNRIRDSNAMGRTLLKLSVRAKTLPIQLVRAFNSISPLKREGCTEIYCDVRNKLAPFQNLSVLIALSNYSKLHS